MESGSGSGAGVGVEELDHNVIKYRITMELEGNQDRTRIEVKVTGSGWDRCGICA